jgi:hypothetical protein
MGRWVATRTELTRPGRHELRRPTTPCITDEGQSEHFQLVIVTMTAPGIGRSWGHAQWARRSAAALPACHGLLVGLAQPPKLAELSHRSALLARAS